VLPLASRLKLSHLGTTWRGKTAVHELKGKALESGESQALRPQLGLYVEVV
jgi:hypothetical protein